MAIQRTRGIDVSYHQGVIDWEAVKAAGVEWIILRAGFGRANVDTQFVNNITGAISAGFDKIGIYWFSYAKDAYNAAEEVNYCLQTVNPYRESITLPIFFDWEGESYSYVQRTYGFTPTPAQIREIGAAWCNGITAAGYTTGVYSNKSNASGWFQYPNGQYLWEALGCEFWYARYGANNETSLFVDPAFEDTALAEHPETNIFQFSDVGRMDGINSQRVDLNIRYEEVDEPEPPPEPEPTGEIVRNISDNIEYVEVRGADLATIGIIDTAKSIIWHTKYYGVGDFEIYIRADYQTVSLLSVGRYITRPNEIDVGIIESVNITDSITNGRMITASGRFAKSILDRRHIYNLSGNSNKATVLSGNVESAIRNVVTDNAINCSFDSSRNIPILALGVLSGISKTIVDENGNAAQKQVSFDNLLTYTDGILEEYEIGSTVIRDEANGTLNYTLYIGKDRSTGNAETNAPVIFSKDYDNLSASNYSYDTKSVKNSALIGGAGEGTERFYALIAPSASGLDRRETWVDASSVNRKYKDDQEVEQEYSDAVYTDMLKTKGKQSIADLVPKETFSGTIDITNGNYLYNRDFFLGDIVTIQDTEIGKYIDVRITEVTEVQDEKGYTIDAKYNS